MIKLQFICLVHKWGAMQQYNTTGQKSHYEPANHHAIHLLKCPIFQVITTCLLLVLMTFTLIITLA